MRFENAAWYPALSGWRVAVGRPVDQTLTLLVGCQDLDLLPVEHRDLILPHRHKVLQHQHQLLKWRMSQKPSKKTTHNLICQLEDEPDRPARCLEEAEGRGRWAWVGLTEVALMIEGG